MLKLISKLVGSKSVRDLKKLQPYVESVNAFEAALTGMSNDQLRERTASFKASIAEATAETKASKDALYAQIENTPDYDAREPLYEQYLSMKDKNYRVSRATLYNTIELLLTCGLVRKHHV